MNTNLKQIQLSDSWVPTAYMEYRGIQVKFYEDCLGHQIITNWEGKVIEFGAYNLQYQDDMKLIIDDYLDTITRFPQNPNLYGSKLTYFQNGKYRDIKLVYRGRILKVYTNVNENDLFSIQADAEEILLNHIEIENS